MATIRDVAALANVSVATVSRVLNRSGYVNLDTEIAVSKAMEQLQFEPNSAARVLAGKKMGAIALIVPDISDPLFPEMAKAVEDTAQQRGYSVILCNSYGQGGKEKSYFEVLSRKSIDGVIIASTALKPEDAGEIQKMRIPVVFMDGGSVADPYGGIRTRHAECVNLAMRHLTEIGCRRIAHICGPQHLYPARQRLSAYEAAVRPLDWYLPTLIAEGESTIIGGQKAAAELLERHPETDGILAGNDLLGIGALIELRRLGVDVPGRVAVCGIDGIPMAQITQPELSTVALPLYEMGEVASRMLIDKIEGIEKINRMYEPDIRLLKRSSTNRS